MPLSPVADAIRTKKAIVFDLYHTLTAVESGWGGGLPSTSEMLGLGHEEWDKQLLERSRDRLVGAKTDPFTIIAEMAHALDPNLSEERIAAATENRIARMAAAVRGIPEENVTVLRQLRAQGKLLGLISNADVMEIAAWDQTETSALFDSTVISCRVGMVKPERGIYERCLCELGVAPEETAFVGDGGSDELQGAKDVGMTAIMFTGVMRDLWPERVTARLQQADYIIERLGELIG